MAVLALASIKGSPGVTAAAVALTTVWQPQSSVLLECDPAGGDLAPGLHLCTTPGLVSLAAVVRREAASEQVWQHAQSQQGLRVVPGPAGAEQARAAIRALAGSPLMAALAGDASVLAVVDCGRLDPESPVLPVVRQAPMLLVFLRPCFEELSHLAPRVQDLCAAARSVGLVLVGRAGFPAQEISGALQLPVVGELPHDPRSAKVLLTAGMRVRRAPHLPLVRAIRTLADRLNEAGVLRPSGSGEARAQPIPPKGWMVGRPVTPEKAGQR